MKARIAGAPASVVLPALISAVVVAGAVVALTYRTSDSRTASRPPAKPRAHEAVRPLPAVTFSPRSSLARLDLRTGEVEPLALGRSFSVADPSLSPSGALAFVASSCASCPEELKIVQGRRTTRLGQATSVAWLDGRTLLVTAGRGEDTDVWRVGASGRRHELDWLSKAAEDQGIENKKDLIASPSGRLLVFSGEGTSEHHGNYVADLLRRRLVPLAGEAEDEPAFSPDGRTIAYQQVARSGDWDLCLSRVFPVATAHERCFRSPAGNDRDPAFVADGRAIVFSSDRTARRAGVSSLYRLDLRTGAVRRLTAPGYDAGSPAVTPDGHGVVFVRRALVPLR